MIEERLSGEPEVDAILGLVRRPPGWLPDNWGLLAMYPSGKGERWRRQYHQTGGVRAGHGPWRIPELPPGPAERVTVVAIPPRLLGSWNHRPDTPVVGHAQVRGRRAEVDADPRQRTVNVRWREGEVGYVVTGSVLDGATLRQAQEVVVRIAQSLR